MIDDRYLFQGKRFDNGNWFNGLLCKFTDNFVHMCDPYRIEYHEVDPATIGQCTGVRNKKGKLFFESHIVVYPDKAKYIPYYDMIEYYPESTSLMLTPYHHYFRDGKRINEIVGRPKAIKKDMLEQMIIIGNKHDNPELIQLGGIV